MKLVAIKYQQFILWTMSVLAFFVIIFLSLGCTEMIDNQIDQKEQYVVTEDSPIIVLPDSEIKIQFIEVFDGNQCGKGKLCAVRGEGKIMIGISGPGLMPFPTELTLGIASNSLFGYSITLENIDRTEPIDSVTLSIKRNEAK